MYVWVRIHVYICMSASPFLPCYNLHKEIPLPQVSIDLDGKLLFVLIVVKTTSEERIILAPTFILIHHLVLNK